MTATPAPGPPRPLSWRPSFLVGLALFVVYMANGREIGTYDTEPTALVTYTILRGDGPVLDRFRRALEGPGDHLPEFVTRSRGHIVSLYPIASALLALPLEWPGLLVMDLTTPSSGRSLGWEYVAAKRLAKWAAAVITALIGVMLDRVLRQMGLSRVATVSVLAVGLGSNLWAVASQAMWQHGPAALALTSTIALLLPHPVSAWRLAAAGVTAGTLVAVRSIDILFAATVFLWIARMQPRGLAWFLPGPVLIGAALVSYNLYYFGAFEGGAAIVESRHPELHAVAGAWSGDVLAGVAGTLFSPSRGLFVFTPWVALSLACLPWTAVRLRRWPPVAWLVAALAAYLLLLSKYAVWWAGWSFGPRYWTDALPLFGILLALALDWSVVRSRMMTTALALTILWGVGVQAIGAFLYPSGWNQHPVNIDLHHERLWDWSDSELTRCLRQAMGS
jgi:hypothetical protein